MGILLMVAESSADTTITQWRCNADEYSANDAYAANVEYIEVMLVSVTPNVGYYYNTQSPADTDICYGLATCSAALTNNDCSDCLSAATASAKEICPFKIGAMVHMVDFALRYENYFFY
ncbi:antifungal protein ginkbilobin-like protein [Salvia splendens]|uniref:antifungal protein ginkbilobin-like protein n=1 Tax=Salvia splendens TaxID=180675 RepID=UPI001C2574C6|nr:antifungal protein ginkbilobin-like protein [Salvia splendens]